MRPRVAATEPAEVPLPVEAPPTSRSGDLPYLWEVWEPHDGFLNPSQVDESHFAATLGGVFAGSAREEYLDPVAGVRGSAAWRPGTLPPGWG